MKTDKGLTVEELQRRYDDRYKKGGPKKSPQGPQLPEFLLKAEKAKNKKKIRSGIA